MTLDDIYDQLLAPFEARRVGLKPQSVKEGKALAVCYVDARTVQERLDQAAGPANWWDSYQVINARSVLCRLTIMGVTKEGIGEAGGTPGEEALKSAESDSFKRAAVKFGVARYLYRLPKRWLRYDGRKFLEAYPGLEQPRPVPLRPARSAQASPS